MTGPTPPPADPARPDPAAVGQSRQTSPAPTTPARSDPAPTNPTRSDPTRSDPTRSDATRSDPPRPSASPDLSAVRGRLADTGRLTSFSDNVISIAITLLILDVRVPDGLGTITVAGVLHLMGARLFGFVLSFAIVGVYWVGHHGMVRTMAAVPWSALWVNNLFLLFVSLVPASAALLGGYPGQPASAVLYGANLVLAGGALLLLWDGAVRFHRRHGMPLDPGLVRLAYARTAMGIGIAVAGIALAAVHPWASYAVYCLTPVLYIALQLGPGIGPSPVGGAAASPGGVSA